jgi:hypothetical protein
VNDKFFGVAQAVADNPKLSRGRVWCIHCGRTRLVDSAERLRMGWPKCCGCTMTLDSPQERSDMVVK